MKEEYFKEDIQYMEKLNKNKEKAKER